MSEFNQGKDGYTITDPNSQPAVPPRYETEGDDYFEDIMDDDADYSKRFTLEDKKNAFKKEYQSSKEALKEFSPFMWKK